MEGGRIGVDWTTPGPLAEHYGRKEGGGSEESNFNLGRALGFDEGSSAAEGVSRQRR